MSFEEHSEQALASLGRVGMDATTTEEESFAVTSAQVHATLALAEAVREVAAAITSRR
jgi:hypothetical protein